MTSLEVTSLEQAVFVDEGLGFSSGLVEALLSAWVRNDRICVTIVSLTLLKNILSSCYKILVRVAAVNTMFVASNRFVFACIEQA